MQIQTPTEQLFFTTIRITTINTEQYESTGTAFIFSYPFENSEALFLVTNKHVVADAMITRFFFTKTEDGQQPLIGQRHDVALQNLQWHGHPNSSIDIAITPLIPILSAIGEKVFFRAIPHSLIPTSEQLYQLDALENVVFVGYPNGLFDTRNLLPILRRGTTATPLQIDYNGEPVFLVDASVFPGSSGSPVFIADHGGYSNRGNFVIGSRVFFLGVIAKVLIRQERGQLNFIPIPTQLVPFMETQQMIDLGIVYKASTVIETIQDFFTFYQRNRETSLSQNSSESEEETTSSK